MVFLRKMTEMGLWKKSWAQARQEYSAARTRKEAAQIPPSLSVVVLLRGMWVPGAARPWFQHTPVCIQSEHVTEASEGTI